MNTDTESSSLPSRSTVGLLSFAGAPAPKKAGIEAKGYKWNAQEGRRSKRSS
jgi:hypothetical protein